ncbi:fructose-specific PTS transporter subunit EIIC [Ligilactobacillus saerimneri]|nr:fructose-specific PTS transporter subunit EIIC [Ligilactobacillus saerimneri]MCZ0892206.1 fructose-specific PTS transporter subunit EIIC [Ligilactobacillus saerimneri]HJF29739.1 fructose-specific PTS transporter subunit EIIC [Ligilactobacillus saerimneri]
MMGNTKKKTPWWATAQKHLMTATGYMIPFVVAGGIIYAVTVMMTGQAAAPTPKDGWIYSLNMIGAAGLALYIPALGGYFSYSLAGRPGIAPGFITAYLAVQVHTGFIGGIIGGLLAGLTVKQLLKIKISTHYKVLGSIFLYPLVGTLIPSAIVLFIIGAPVASFMTWMTDSMAGLSGAAKVPLGALLGGMLGFDMGGPINKVAATFCQTQVDKLPFLMGIMGPAVATPPIGMGIATLLFKKKFSPEERQTGLAGILMGCCGITEGAIPFATADPLRVIPANTIGSIVAGMISAYFGVASHAPWGGLITLPVVENRLWYIGAVLIGSLVTAVIVGLWKKDWTEEAAEVGADADDEFDFDVETF